MGNLKESMLRLRAQMQRDHIERKQMCEDLKVHKKQVTQSVEDLLNQTRKERLDKSREAINNARAYMDELRDIKKQLRNSDQQRKLDFMSSFEKEASSMHQDRVGFLADMRNDVSTMLADSRKKRADSKKIEAQARAAFRETLVDADLIRKEEVISRREQVQKSMRDIHERLNTAKKELNNTAVADRSERRAFVGAIKQGVAELLHDSQVKRGKLLQELTEIRTVWSENSNNIEETIVHPDTIEYDLTLINGIGPRRSQQLNDAGITTLLQLIEASDDVIIDILGDKIGTADVKDWIAQAEDLVRKIK